MGTGPPPESRPVVGKPGAGRGHEPQCPCGVPSPFPTTRAPQAPHDERPWAEGAVARPGRGPRGLLVLGAPRQPSPALRVCIPSA